MKYNGETGVYTLNKGEWKRLETAAKKVYTVNKKAGHGIGKAFCGVFYMPSGEAAVCDGFRVYRFASDLPDLPHVYGDAVDAHLSVISKFMENAKEKNYTRAAMEMPPLELIKEHVQQDRTITVGGVIFRAENLLEIMTGFPGVTFRAPETGIEPVYFESPAGDGIIMPCRPPKTKEEQEQEEAKRKEEEAKRKEAEKAKQKERAEKNAAFVKMCEEADRALQEYLETLPETSVERVRRILKKTAEHEPTRIVSRATAVYDRVKNGAMPIADLGRYALKRDGCGVYLVTKAAYDFACFLASNKQAETEEERAAMEAEQAQREQEEKEREAKERAERLLPFEGWLDGKSACSAGRIMRTMEKKVRYNGKIYTRTEYVKVLLSEGYLPRRFDADCYLAKADPDSSRCSIGYTVTKTEFDFACYLLEKKQAETVEEPETVEHETTVEATPDYAAFEAAYRHEYSRLYFCGKPYASAVDEFADRLKNDAAFLDFLRGFNRYTQDCVASDREAAAFVNVYNARTA